MTTIGDAGAWSDLFPQGLIPRIIDMVITAWQSFRQPTPDEREVGITRRFVVHLCKQKNHVHLPVHISRESPEDDAATAEEIGRIDVRFTHGYREDVYYSFECKRLNVTTASGRQSRAGEYVTQGMMRYVEGRYARNLTDGGMLAYVMDGKVEVAFKALRRACLNHRDALRFIQGGLLSRSSLLPGNPSVKESKHNIQGRRFLIHHVLLRVKTPDRPSSGRTPNPKA